MSPGATSPIRVLVVDDSAQVRALVGLVLRRSGRFAVAGEAADGAAAVEAARELRPDVVLLDLAMPRMDGLQALPGLRDAAPGSTIVVYSGFAAGGFSQNVLGAGADAYLEKRSLLALPTSLSFVLDELARAEG